MKTGSVDENNLPENLVVIETKHLGGTEYKYIKPFQTNGKWYMAGGNIGYSCDSRFCEISTYPLNIHDRTDE